MVSSLTRIATVSFLSIFILHISWTRDAEIKVARAESVSDAERVAQNKATLLSRLNPEEPKFREAGNTRRLRWEWYDKVVSDYFHEKLFLIVEQSQGEKYVLRPAWVFQDMKMTFGEAIGLGEEYDDVLMPVVAHLGAVRAAPNETFAGLTLYGKKGEIKGTITRKYKTLIGYDFYATRIEYEDRKGKRKKAFSQYSWDAFNLRWGDIRNRTLDDMTQAKQMEDLRMQRDARSPATE